MKDVALFSLFVLFFQEGRLSSLWEHQINLKPWHAASPTTTGQCETLQPAKAFPNVSQTLKPFKWEGRLSLLFFFFYLLIRYLFLDGESHFEVELSRISSMQILTDGTSPGGKTLQTSHFRLSGVFLISAAVGINSFCFLFVFLALLKWVVLNVIRRWLQNVFVL